MMKETSMSVAKVMEICSESPRSFEDAIEAGIAQAQKTLKNVRAAWVEGQKVEIEDGKIAVYRVDLKVTFVLA
jgi:flavin-binding protein dodecin